MKTPRSRIADIVAKRLDKVSSKELSQEIAAYLLSEGRVQELEPLLRDVMQKRAENGTVEVTAVSARRFSYPADYLRDCLLVLEAVRVQTDSESARRAPPDYRAGRKTWRRDAEGKG